MNRSYNKIRHIQETNQKLENRVLNEQVNPRVQALLNYLKKFSFTPQEVQQAQVALKAPQAAAKPAAPQQQKKIGGLNTSQVELNPPDGGA
jgi:hypothetical protein